MLKNILQRLRGAKKYSYEEAREALEIQNKKDKSQLACHEDTKPEILYYLATDQSEDVRRSVAMNKSTPHQADQLLVEDEDQQVRQELARKIARLLPDLDSEEITNIREQVIEILEKLADDQLPEVRAILAEELKTFSCAPKHIIRQLADDDVTEVCAPILEYSPLLGTEDLREIIAATKAEGALTAIARRCHVDEDISDDITASLDIPAVAALLANKNAQIRETTLDAIIDQATEVKKLHSPLATRPGLSIRAIKRIAGFVASSLVNQMIQSNDLDEAVADDLLSRAKKRIEKKEVGKDDTDSLEKRAGDFYAQGLLDDTFIENTIKNRQRELLQLCLSQMAKMPLESIQKILRSKKARRVVALAWRCELNMRTALKIQQEIACIPTSQIIHARDGRIFPLSEMEMKYDLALYKGGD